MYLLRAVSRLNHELHAIDASSPSDEVVGGLFSISSRVEGVEVGTGCCVLFDGVTRPWDSWRPADAVAAPLAPDSPVDLRTGYAEENPVIHLQSCSHDTVH